MIRTLSYISKQSRLSSPACRAATVGCRKSGGSREERDFPISHSASDFCIGKAQLRQGVTFDAKVKTFASKVPVIYAPLDGSASPFFVVQVNTARLSCTCKANRPLAARSCRAPLGRICVRSIYVVPSHDSAYPQPEPKRPAFL